MATSDSDSENDFASADEGDPETIDHHHLEHIIHPAEQHEGSASEEGFAQSETENSSFLLSPDFICKPEPEKPQSERKSENASVEEADPSQHKSMCIEIKPKPVKIDQELTRQLHNENGNSIGKKIQNVDEQQLFIPVDTKGNTHIEATLTQITETTEGKRAEIGLNLKKRPEKPENENSQTKVIKTKMEENLTRNENSRDCLTKTGKSNRRVLSIEKKLSNNSLKEKEKVTEKEAAVLERLCAANKDEKKTSPGWGLGWSSSFISTAASSVSTFTSHVTQGIGTVLETVEATLGAPTPEELAASSKRNDETEKHKESPLCKDTPDDHEEGILPGSLLGGVTALTRVLESTGSKVLTGGLDTLELIGKKTMDILTEGDPGLRNKRRLFGGNDVTLSQILRETRNKIDKSSNADSPIKDVYPVHYSKLFDEFQGLVHLEALEILSEQSKTKLEDRIQILDSDGSQKLICAMEDIRSLCEDLPPTDDTPDEETVQDFEKLVLMHWTPLSLPINLDKIMGLQIEAKKWICNCKEEQEDLNSKEAKDIYTKAIMVLAELTARSMELFHKIAEIVLVTGSDIPEAYKQAQHLTRLTAVLCTEIGIFASQFCHCLGTAADDSEDPDSINPLITNVFLEAANSNTYIQDAFQLLIPVLQEIASKDF